MNPATEEVKKDETQEVPVATPVPATDTPAEPIKKEESAS